MIEKSIEENSKNVVVTSSEKESSFRFRSIIRRIFRFRNGDGSVRDALDEIIDGREELEVPINADEKVLLSNILELRNRKIRDVMIPRADIIGVEVLTSLSEVIETIINHGHSRLPVYSDTLDDTTGFIHAKDVLAWRESPSEFKPKKISRRILFVSPFMQVLELLFEMRSARSHMALVVDEFGGVDGLVAIEDLVEEIVGEIEDEHDHNLEPDLVLSSNGEYLADARVTLANVENKLGPFLNEEERENLDTLGGLVFSITGHVPIRGELIQHHSGIEFEILDADPRRIKRLKLGKIYKPHEKELNKETSREP